MRRASNTKQLHVHTIDLTRIRGDGDFKCPRCGNIISPDDRSEKAYSILEPKVNSHGLEEILIRFIRCESLIRLTGFFPARNMPAENKKKTRVTKNVENRYYITHV